MQDAVAVLWSRVSSVILLSLLTDAGMRGRLLTRMHVCRLQHLGFSPADRRGSSRAEQRNWNCWKVESLLKRCPTSNHSVFDG